MLPQHLSHLPLQYIVVSAAKETVERKNRYIQAIWDDLKTIKQKMQNEGLKVEFVRKEPTDFTVYRIIWEGYVYESTYLNDALKNRVKSYIKKRIEA